MALLVTTLPLRPSAADQVISVAECRITLGSNVRHFAGAIGLRIAICQRLRMIGKIDPSVDCNDPSSWQGSSYADGAEAFDRALARFDAQTSDCALGIDDPPEAGYTACPAPCDALPVSTFPELGECLKCVTLASVSTTHPDVLGSPPLPITLAGRKCQEAISRGIVVYMNKRMNLQNECQFYKDINEPGFDTVGCSNLEQPSNPYGPGSGRGRAKLQSQIQRRCEGVDLATQLDTCGSDPSSEVTCVLDAIDQWSTTLHSAVYP